MPPLRSRTLRKPGQVCREPTDIPFPAMWTTGGHAGRVMAIAKRTSRGESQIGALGRRVSRPPDGATSWEEFYSGGTR